MVERDKLVHPSKNSMSEGGGNLLLEDGKGSVDRGTAEKKPSASKESSTRQMGSGTGEERETGAE